jgi:hypothetical protein
MQQWKLGSKTLIREAYNIPKIKKCKGIVTERERVVLVPGEAGGFRINSLEKSKRADIIQRGTAMLIEG